jgi:hypothetical protein
MPAVSNPGSAASAPESWPPAALVEGLSDASAIRLAPYLVLGAYGPEENWGRTADIAEGRRTAGELAEDFGDPRFADPAHELDALGSVGHAVRAAGQLEVARRTLQAYGQPLPTFDSSEASWPFSRAVAAPPPGDPEHPEHRAASPPTPWPRMQDRKPDNLALLVARRSGQGPNAAVQRIIGSMVGKQFTASERVLAVEPILPPEQRRLVAATHVVLARRAFDRFVTAQGDQA